MNALEELRRQYPWPAECPDVKPAPHHGWFHSRVQQHLRPYVQAKPDLILELGSWLGMSSRWFLTVCPQAMLICIDHWKGSREHRRRPDCARFMKDDMLYKTFLRNNWKFRDRLVPVRTTTLEGMREVAELGLRPKILYVDASHDTPSVIADAGTALKLFPGAQVTGDDFCWKSVAAGVKQVARETGATIEHNNIGWSLVR